MPKVYSEGKVMASRELRLVELLKWGDGFAALCLQIL